MLLAGVTVGVWFCSNWVVNISTCGLSSGHRASVDGEGECYGNRQWCTFQAIRRRVRRYKRNFSSEIIRDGGNWEWWKSDGIGIEMKQVSVQK